MSGKSLQELGLKAENLPTAGQSLADLPEFGSYDPPPQPGDYRFRLPANLASVWEVFDLEGKGQRVRAIFDKDAPLLIVQSPGNQSNNETFKTRIANNERERGKKGSGVIASDMDYLLRAFKITQKPANNQAYISAVVALAGKEFNAKITYSFKCDENRDIYVVTPDGTRQKVEGTKGCGAKYYQKDLEKGADGKFPDKITCTCGAEINAFANLDNFSA